MNLNYSKQKKAKRGIKYQYWFVCDFYIEEIEKNINHSRASLTTSKRREKNHCEFTKGSEAIERKKQKPVVIKNRDTRKSSEHNSKQRYNRETIYDIKIKYKKEEYISEL